MILALEAMDNTLAGIFFLIAVVLFVIAAFWSYRPGVSAEGRTIGFVPLGLAFFAAVFCWNAFAAS